MVVGSKIMYYKYKKKNFARSHNKQSSAVLVSAWKITPTFFII